MFIEEVRKKRGMTRAALSQLSGISVHTLNNWERGNKMPSADNLALLCLYLRLDPRKALLYALGRGQGEWNDFYPPGYGGENAEKDRDTWAAFLAFLDDLNTSPPITDPAIQKPSRTSEGARDNQIAQLASAVAQLTTTVAHLLPHVASKENGPVQNEPSRSTVQTKPEEAVGAASKHTSMKARLK